MKEIKTEGMCYLASTSKHAEVYVYFSDDDVITLISKNDGQVIARANITDIKVSSKLGNTPRQFAFPDKQLLLLTASETIEQWLALRGNKSPINGLEKNTKLILASVIIIPLLLFSFFRYAIPAIAVNFAYLIPETAIDVSSRHTLQGLDSSILNTSKLSQDVQDQYKIKWQGNIESLLGNSQQYQLLFRQSKILGANAFALPNGTIVVTDDLINLLSEHQDAIFAILLHEIGHVEKRHSMRYVAESIATSITVSYLFGDVSGMLDLFVGTGATIIGNKFSQKLEWEADDFAIKLLKQNGESAESFAKAMEILYQELGKSESSLDKLFSTHPMLLERAKNARN